MNINEFNPTSNTKTRKMDFIKYANHRSYISKKTSVITDCFNNSLMRENHLIALNFTA